MENRNFIEQPLDDLVSMIKSRINDSTIFADGKLTIRFHEHKEFFEAVFVLDHYRRYRYLEPCIKLSDLLIRDTLAFLQARVSDRVTPIIKTSTPEIISEPIRANSFVWIQMNRKKKLALVVSVRLHTVVARIYLQKINRFSSHSETFTIKVVQRATLNADELRQIACGKHILTKNKALQLVAVNFVFTDIDRRKERRVYYCPRCQGFHTTSMRWLPKSIRDKLRSQPFTAYLERNGISNINPQALYQWLKEDIGLNIGYKIFLKMLNEFEPDGQLAIKTLLNTPAKYVEFVLYEFFHYKNNHNDIPPIQP